MVITKRSVAIFQAPKSLTPASASEVLQSLKATALSSGRALFVLDCSALKSITPTEANFLLSCLEEVMKHNGDLRLARLNATAKAELSQVGVNHLFEVFGSTEQAVASYQTRRTSMAPFNYLTDVIAVQNECAA